MDAFKPLIEPETRFLKSDDFVSPMHNEEEGVIEEGLETFVRKYGIGDKASLFRETGISGY